MQVRHVITVQYLRAVAASAVVAHHALDLPEINFSSAWLGQFGVSLFFVISGYIMWVTTEGNARGSLEFWRARIRRIVPLYWFFTSLYLGIALLLPGILKSEYLDLTYVAKSYLFIPAVNENAGDMQPLYSLGWTLNYEMFFYFLFGLCLFIKEQSLRLAAIVATLLTLVTVGALSAPSDPVLAVYTSSVLLQFVAGVLLGRASHLIMGLGHGAGTSMIVCGIAAIFALENSSVTFGLAGALVLSGALTFEPSVRQRSSKILTFLGDASYSIYLAHPFALRPVRIIATNLGATGSLAGSLLVAIVSTFAGIAIGVVSYLSVERAVRVPLSGPEAPRARTKSPSYTQ